MEFELPGPLVVVVVVVVDWELLSFPEGELPLLFAARFIESNVFSILLLTALFVESVRLWAYATYTIVNKNIGNKIKTNFMVLNTYHTLNRLEFWNIGLIFRYDWLLSILLELSRKIEDNGGLWSVNCICLIIVNLIIK